MCTQGPANLPLNGTYTITPSTGRVTLSASFNVSLPVLYLAAPVVASTEDITAFIVGTDPTGSLDSIEPGATSAVTTNSLAGSYFFGDELPRDGTVPNRVGIVAICHPLASPPARKTIAPLLASLPSGQLYGHHRQSSGYGTGNVGANCVAVTNGDQTILLREWNRRARAPAHHRGGETIVIGLVRPLVGGAAGVPARRRSIDRGML